MSKIWQVPIEPLEERYSSQWLDWFEEEFTKLKIPFESLTESPLSYEIRQGSFLDVIGTNYYKAQQLQSICIAFEQGRIKDNDVIFFHDGWFPGLEMIAYIRDALHKKVKLYSFFHAGTYDHADFLTQMGMRHWGRFCERSWFEIYDGVFVATNFHKKLILEGFYDSFIKPDGSLTTIANKIHVTGLPIYPEFVKKTKKENIVVFPHRLDPEKQPELFDQAVEELKPLYPNWNFVKSKSLHCSKRHYYHLLNHSKIAVSCALQETFGIAMAEAVLCGCVPIVPNRLSYKELYHPAFKYYDNSELKGRIQTVIDNYEDFEKVKHFQQVRFRTIGSEAIPNMVNIIMGNKNE